MKVTNVFLNKLIDNKEFDTLNKLLVRVLPRKQKLTYAIFAAEHALVIYEKLNPGNNNPRLAIEAAKKVLEDDSPENRRIARQAALESDNTAYNHHSASKDYYNILAVCAASAAYAADAASNTKSSKVITSAYGSVIFSAYSTDEDEKTELILKILNYGISLFKGVAK